MSSFFGASPVEKKIEAATGENFVEAPLETYLEIAEDVSKSTDAGAQHLKYIRKRLGHRSPQIQFLATQLLDVCVKNGRDAFHETVSNREFLDYFATFATNQKIPHIRDLALGMIQSWSKAFPQTGLTSFNEVYAKMRNRGVPFPETSAPVLTPPVNLSVVAQRKSSNRTQDRSPVPRSPKPASDERKEPHPLSYTSDAYVSKVKTECGQVIDYLRLFIDMLVSANDANDINTNEAISGLHSTILDCRNRVAHLLIELEHEVLMDLMLTMNELIRVSLEFYQTKASGNNSVRPPVIELPAALQPQSQSSGQLGEHEEKHSEPGSVSHSMQSLTISSPQLVQPSSSPAKAVSPLAEFDPLA